MGLNINKLLLTDRAELREFIILTLKDTFEKDEINDEQSLNEVIHEIGANLDHYFNQKSRNELYLIAKEKGQIVGQIGLGKPNQIILNHSSINPEKVLEIKNVYVHPQFQRRGIGKRMFGEILKELKRRNLHSFCLDCGYSISHLYWQKLLGKPEIILPEYWGNGADH